ncbi:MAG TPA: alpha-hydroxy-acid oxidizing protein, partial [Pseudonocardiaceae bacterium]|nr:alpha-hydroxy-acid oxidizing protein [Pseudonocardiaceae bacterium]
MQPLRVEEYAELAEAKVTASAWGYVQGGGGVEWTLAENRAAFARVAVRPRFLVDVEQCDTSTELLGSRLATPIGVAP